jgi:hypothetical protein
MKLPCVYWQNRLVSRRDGLGKEFAENRMMNETPKADDEADQ